MLSFDVAPIPLATDPFGDTANITVSTSRPLVAHVRIPAWAISATVNGAAAPNGTLVGVQCDAGRATAISVDLAPSVRLIRGWGVEGTEGL